MSAIHVLEYGIGLAVFGFTYWILNGIQEEIQGVSQTGDTYDIIMYFWIGILLMYLIFGGIWVVRKYNEIEYRGGGGF